MFDVIVMYEGNEILAQISAEEAYRVMNDITWSEIAERVREFMSEHYPDAKELYGSNYDSIIGTIAKEVKIFTCDDRLSVDEIEDSHIDEIFREMFMPFGEIRYDYYDDVQKCHTIDGWKTSDDNEEGVVIAKVFADRVEFSDTDYANCLDVLRAIEIVKNEMVQ